MLFSLIKSRFESEVGTPDGASVHFLANSLALWKKLDGTPVRLGTSDKSKNITQTPSLENIEAIKTTTSNMNWFLRPFLSSQPKWFLTLLPLPRLEARLWPRGRPIGSRSNDSHPFLFSGGSMRIIHPVRLLALSTLLLSLTGCGLSMFAGQKTPVIEDKVGSWSNHQVGTLAVTTDRRVVLVRLQGDSEGGAGRFCAEPPPDAGQNLTSALTAMLDVSAEKLDATLKAELAKSFASNFQSFVKRSQGLQLYRDAMYNLCQGYLNHALEKGEVKTISGERVLPRFHGHQVKSHCSVAQTPADLDTPVRGKRFQ